jgi:hypothetical protein
MPELKGLDPVANPPERSGSIGKVPSPARHQLMVACGPSNAPARQVWRDDRVVSGPAMLFG